MIIPALGFECGGADGPAPQWSLGHCGFGLLLPFVGHGVLLNQSIQRVQELAAPAVVVNLVHILR